MIEPTEEIQRAYAEAWFRAIGMDEEDARQMAAAELAEPMPWRLAALTAVLAIVERQHQEEVADAYQRGWWRGQHRLCPRCGVELEREVAEERAVTPPGDTLRGPGRARS